ncbi:MAG: hypothetical protein IJ994_03265 [Firmicutes bacterium]|nr:hypothetical protein [Bacillota bacterium]MBR7147391.1 hypothetical protein [Bacillota bacterium]
MKVLIVFLGLLLINLSFLSYHSDLDRYEKLQTQLKAAAEEAAAGASLCQDEAQYGKGYLVIDGTAAEEYVTFVTDHVEQALPEYMDAEVSYEMRIFDDEKGYDGIEEYGVSEPYPAVWVRMTADSKDLFRLPFLEKTRTKRSAIYQWDTWKGL